MRESRPTGTSICLMGDLIRVWILLHWQSRQDWDHKLTSLERPSQTRLLEICLLQARLPGWEISWIDSNTVLLIFSRTRGYPWMCHREDWNRSKEHRSRTVAEGTFWRKITVELLAEKVGGVQKSVLLEMLMVDVVEHCWVLDGIWIKCQRGPGARYFLMQDCSNMRTRGIYGQRYPGRRVRMNICQDGFDDCEGLVHLQVPGQSWRFTLQSPAAPCINLL